MGQRVNIILEDRIWQTLKQVPLGERSRVVNAAIAEWFKLRKRADAARKMDALRQRMPAVSTKVIVDWIRAERDRVR